jgi:hypothetical protein
MTTFRHDCEYQALLRLTPYDELRVNGSTGADHSEQIDDLERQASEDGRAITIFDADDFGYIVELVPQPLPLEERTRRGLFGQELMIKANRRGHDFSVTLWRAVGGRFAAGCSCGARLWADSTVDPPVIDGDELLETDCQQPGVEEWRREQRRLQEIIDRIHDEETAGRRQ